VPQDAPVWATPTMAALVRTNVPPGRASRKLLDSLGRLPSPPPFRAFSYTFQSARQTYRKRADSQRWDADFVMASSASELRRSGATPPRPGKCTAALRLRRRGTASETVGSIRSGSAKTDCCSSSSVDMRAARAASRAPARRCAVYCATRSDSHASLRGAFPVRPRGLEPPRTIKSTRPST